MIIQMNFRNNKISKRIFSLLIALAVISPSIVYGAVEGEGGIRSANRSSKSTTKAVDEVYREDFGKSFLPTPSTSLEFGSVSNVRPPNSKKVAINNKKYLFSNGNFFQLLGKKYVVTKPPVGVKVGSLPPRAIRTNVNGNVIFQANGVCYKPAMQNGSIVYSVVEMPV